MADLAYSRLLCMVIKRSTHIVPAGWFICYKYIHLILLYHLHQVCSKWKTKTVQYGQNNIQLIAACCVFLGPFLAAKKSANKVCVVVVLQAPALRRWAHYAHLYIKPYFRSKCANWLFAHMLVQSMCITVLGSINIEYIIYINKAIHIFFLCVRDN